MKLSGFQTNEQAKKFQFWSSNIETWNCNLLSPCQIQHNSSLFCAKLSQLWAAKMVTATETILLDFNRVLVLPYRQVLSMVDTNWKFQGIAHHYSVPYLLHFCICCSMSLELYKEYTVWRFTDYRIFFDFVPRTISGMYFKTCLENTDYNSQNCYSFCVTWLPLYCDF